MESGAEYTIHSQSREQIEGHIRARTSERFHGRGRQKEDGAAAAAAVREEEEEEEEIDMFADPETPVSPSGLIANNAVENSQPPPTAAEAEASMTLPAAASLQGFVPDSSTGYLYNSLLGAYYDPDSQLFGDAASGLWYRLDHSTGKYVVV